MENTSPIRQQAARTTYRHLVAAQQEPYQKVQLWWKMFESFL